MPIRLLVTPTAASGTDGAKAAPEELRLDGDEIVIGRDKTCQVSLTEQSVSRSHARITRDQSLYFLEDSGSAFGTRVNGQVLPRGEKRLLRNGDVIAVGTFDIAFSRILETTQPEDDSTESTGALARAVVKDALRGLGAAGTPYLRVMNGPLEGRRFEMNEASELVVGRQDSCAIVLDDDLTSRRHAKLRRDWSGTHVEDLGSRNGVKVNRKLISGPTTLRDRDEVEIGGTRLLFVDPTALADAPEIPSIEDPAPDPTPRPAAVERLPEAPPESAPASGLAPETSPMTSGEPPLQPPTTLTEIGETGPDAEGAARGADSVDSEPGSEDSVGEGPVRSSPHDWLPRDREAVLRLLPLLVVAAVVLAGLVVLVLVFA